ncbi:MAG TPA: caspase family protein, partial [Pyrinomonadaceae bacterium]
IHTGAVHNIVFSRDKNFLATSDQTVINIKQWARLQGVKLPPDFGKWVKGLSSDETIRVFNMKTGKLKELTLKPKTEVKEDSLSFEVSALVFSHNSKMLAASGNKIVKIWKIETDEEPIVINEEASSLAFSRDDKVLALGDYYGGQIKLRNLETKKQVALPAGKDANYYLEGMAFSEKDKNLVCYLENYERKKLVRVYDLESSALKEEFYPEVNPDQYIRALRLVPDLYQEINFPYMDNNRFYAAPNLNGRIGLYDNGEDIFRDDDDKLIAWLITLDKSDWAVVTPNGRFDTNNLEDSQGLNWIFPDAPLKPLPFEVLMRDYYEPGLLPRLIKCTENKNCETEFKLISRDVSALNRTLPKVEITKIQPTSEPDVVKVTVEVTDRESDFQKDQQGKFLHSGVEDLRIFRDGKLVGYAPQPENENKIRLDKNGKASFTFDTKLPRSSNIKEVEFSAYAFNSDHIRSEISRKIYKLEKPLPDIKGKAYLFTIGVNTNESPALSLSYAAKDALDLQDEVAPRLKASGKYADVVQISLISAELDGKSITDATKAKIKAVFDILAGKKVPAEILAGVPNAEKLSKVQPEDFVLIAFSGHGYADQNGIFYFVPYDTGNFATARQNEKLISSNDLSFWLRDIDAREMIMIVDACHSAAAFQDKGFKPGPIGSQGLAQLSYDKGIQILAATQANNAARETEELKNGLLTYALTKDGIRENKADSEPQDKILMSNEWLSFAVRRVPELYEAQRKKKNAAKVPPPPDVPIDALNDNSKDGVQQPVLFNFNKRHSTFELWKIQ